MSSFPTGPRRYAENRPSYGATDYNPATLNADPITDSGIHRFMLGTRVRLHLHGGIEIEVGLTAVRDVNTWSDLVDRIVRAMPLEVMASRRRVFGGGVVLWAEVSSDPEEEPERGQ